MNQTVIFVILDNLLSFILLHQMRYIYIKSQFFDLLKWLLILKLKLWTLMYKRTMVDEIMKLQLENRVNIMYSLLIKNTPIYDKHV